MRHITQDTICPVLGVRQGATGARYIVTAQRGKRRIFQTLGDTNAMTLREARARATAIIEAASSSNIRTLSEACDIYMQHQAAKLRSHKDIQRRIDKRIKPTLGAKPIANIAPIDIANWFKGIERKIEANRCLVLLRTLYNYLAKMHIWEGRSPCTAIDLHTETPRTEHLQPEELIRVTEQLLDNTPQNSRTKGQRIAILLLILTACRKSEILSLKWDNVDIDGKVALLDDTKNGKPRLLALSPEAIEVLEMLPGRSGWCFPSDSVTGHVLDVRKTWSTVLKEAGITRHVTIHDIRRSIASLLIKKGISIEVIAKTLGQSGSYVTRRYAILNNSAERDCLNMAAGIIMQRGRSGDKKSIDVANEVG